MCIRDRTDTDEALVVTREDGSLLVDGGLHVQELRELTGERLACLLYTSRCV